MTVKELMEMLKSLDEDTELEIVSMRGDACQVDEIAHLMAPANDERSCYYLYTEEALSEME